MGTSAVTKEDQPQKSNYQFKFNGDICLGCGTCVSVCSIYKEGVVNDLLARIKQTRHIFEIEYTVDFCRQCHHAECYYACPENAISIHPKTGARIIDESACTGCKLCIEACPFNIMFFSQERNVALKCDLCDGEPQCVKFCPSGALSISRI